jgi:hypothetical protein
MQRKERSGPWIPQKALPLHFQIAWMPNVVMIQKCDQVTPRFTAKHVARVSNATVLLCPDSDAGFVRPHDRNRVVRAPVVEDQDLVRCTGLGENRIERDPDETGRVVRRDDDADFHTDKRGDSF